MSQILDSLGFNTHIFVFQIVMFIVLLAVMKAIYWDPMLKHLDGREQSVKNAYSAVDNTRHEMEQLRADYQTRIAAIEAEARTHIQAAIKEAQHERERVLSEARTAADEAIRKGLAETEADKARSLGDMQTRMIALATAAAGHALGSAADTAAIKRTVEQRISRIGLDGGAERLN